MRSNSFKFILALLFVAVTGYFFDLECLVNRCEAGTQASTSEHGECISPAVMPDLQVPAVAPEFTFPPVVIVAPLTDAPSPPPQSARSELRPPPVCTFHRQIISRRGPPLTA